MKITTKTGDKGETSLFGGRRVSKSSDFISVVGELDELQALVGWCAVEVKRERDEWAGVFERVVDDIYRMMSIVGFEFKCPGNIRVIDESDVEFLEGVMAGYEKEVGDLSKFIRPGGSELSARLHIVRTVCRRVERGVVGVMSVLDGEKVGAAAGLLKYLNRLSDLLFVLAYVDAIGKN